MQPVNNEQKMKKIIVFIFAALVFNSCDVLNQIGGAYNLSQCEYSYRSLSDIQLAGINLGNASSISLSSLASISTILAGGNLQAIPFNMTLNIDVKNPNQKAAFLNALDYSIAINELDFAQGKIDIPFDLAPNETKTLPISVGVDLKTLMNRYSQERVAKEMGAFLGIISDETKVTVKLWPKVLVGETPIKVPAPIPLEFTFGGK